MKIIYMGTPEFAVPALETLATSRHEVSLVVTQPDRSKGRSGKPVAPPVKECAQKYGIPVFQPVKVRVEEAVRRLEEENADIIIVAAYGQILPSSILNMTRFGCVNIHGSLLPKYRGAAPIQWAVINGEQKSGITIMQMDEGVDTGDILMQSETPLSPRETAQSLYDRLSVMGGSMILEALDAIENGTAVRTRQDENLASHTRMLKKDMGRIDWNAGAYEIDRLIRGVYPWPGAFTTLDGRQLKIWAAEVAEGIQATYGPGRVQEVRKDALLIGTGDGVLAVQELQLEGKKRLPAGSFLLGSNLKPGDPVG